LPIYTTSNLCPKNKHKNEKIEQKKREFCGWKSRLIIKSCTLSCQSLSMQTRHASEVFHENRKTQGSVEAIQTGVPIPVWSTHSKSITLVPKHHSILQYQNRTNWNENIITERERQRGSIIGTLCWSHLNRRTKHHRRQCIQFETFLFQ
jgi:hypothetical protein